MSVFKCKMCGGVLEINENQTTAVCEYCGTNQTLPKLDDDRRANLYDRANHFRRNNEFDKAMSIYEQILNEDSTDAEAYWSLVLCRYGIEYVEDPTTHKRMPTVNRAQFTAIFDDDNYKSALQYADGCQRLIYEAEAIKINEIQKEILAISQKEDPFEVFICYKETDQNGRRTPDSVLANDLYHQLTQEGFKVFFSRITLEDKLGTAYEPYIFAALNSAKVMVVLGTRPEHFNAVWVKNEWSRYLALVKESGGMKILIPAYRDMDPYDLPEEFSHLQAQDMSKLGFMQDLIRGIKKITKGDISATPVKETVVISGGNADTGPLLKRAFMFLEDGDFKSANEYCEKVLDLNPECAEAYLGKLMAELKVTKKAALGNQASPFDDNQNYQKALRFGDTALKAELEGYTNKITEAIQEEIYIKAKEVYEKSTSPDLLLETAKKLKAISGYKDADTLATACENKHKNIKYDTAVLIMQVAHNRTQDYEKAIGIFQSVSDWKDSQEKIALCKQRIEELTAPEKAMRIAVAEKEKKERRVFRTLTILIFSIVIVVLILFKTVIIPNQRFKDIVAVSAGTHHTVYLQSDGTVIAVGKNSYGECDVSGWTDIIAVSAGDFHTVGLKSDGTVVAIGENEDGECDVGDWKDIVAVSAGWSHTIGLKSDGTVVAVGSNGFGQCSVSGWTDIVAVSAGVFHTVGLKSDGTVVAFGYNEYGECDVRGWRDIVAISAGWHHTVGLKSDGTVVAVGESEDGQCTVGKWTDVVAVSAGLHHTVGLKSNGTVMVTGDNKYNQCDVSEWTDIVAVSANELHTVGLKSDGTVVAVGDNSFGKCRVGHRIIGNE